MHESIISCIGRYRDVYVQESEIMPIFRDPIQSLSVEIPAGWAYDAFSSSLTNFYFSRWDRPEDVLAVRIRKPAADEGETDEQWMEQIRNEIGEANPLTDIPCSSGRAVAATFTSPAGLLQRVAFLRSRPVELFIEQRGADTEAADPWEALNRAVRTAIPGANNPMQGDFGPEEFNRWIEAANQAFEKEDEPSVIDALKNAIQTGSMAWLHNLAAPDGRLEVHAPMRVAQALVNLGRFTENPYLSRDAEFILLRIGRTLEDAGPPAGPVQELVKEIEETLANILTDLLGPSESGGGESPSPVLAMRERGFRAAQAATKAFEAQDWDKADSLAGAAVEDLLSLIGFLRRNGSHLMPEEVSAQLAADGITDVEEQRKVLQNARESILFPPLNISLQVQFCCAMNRQDAESAADAVSILLPLARFLSEADPKDAGIMLNLVVALLSASGSAALSSRDAEIADAKRLLYDANRALLSLGDPSGADDRWIRHHGKQIEAILNALDHKMAAEETESLKLFCAQFKKISGSYQDTVVTLPQAQAREN